MSKRTLLISTIGRTDLQVVLRRTSDDSLRRYSLRKQCIRQFQSACLSCQIQFDILGLEQTLPIEARGFELTFDPDALSLSTPLTGRTTDETIWPNGKFILKSHALCPILKKCFDLLRSKSSELTIERILCLLPNAILKTPKRALVGRASAHGRAFA